MEPTTDLEALLAVSAAALDSGRCVEGAEMSRRAIRAAAAVGDRPREAAALSLLARQLTRTGDYESCASACDRAAAILRELDDQAGLCDILIVQALALNELGLSEGALNALDVAHEVAVRLNDPTLLYWVLNRIAVVHSGLQDFSRAQDFQLRALALAGGLDDDARFCIINNLADNAVGLSRQIRDAGDQAAADRVVQDGLAHAEAAMGLAVCTANTYREVLALDNSGMLLALAGEHGQALDRLDAALRLSVERGYHSMEMAVCFHLAAVLMLQGRTWEAVPALEAVLEQAVELNERPAQLDILLALSQALEQTGQFEPALHRHKEFVTLERQLRSGVAATRARMLVHLVDLENARLEAALARNETRLHRARTEVLEDEKLALQLRALDLDRRVNQDALTGIGNRHLLETELPRLFAEAQAHEQPLSVVIADLDHFKHVNDTFGHSVGDSVLVRVATLLGRRQRVGDLVGRLGGEEFLLAYPGLDEDAAVEVCRQLRLKIAEDDWDAIRPGLRVTVSLGVCARSDEADVDEMVERADAALYRAKRAGRNRVERHTRRTAQDEP